jgi:hypothetical protein
LLSVRVVELMAFQRSKILDIDDDTYTIISHYRDFSLESFKAYRHLSELVAESIQMKLCCFFFLDIFMRDLNLLFWAQSKMQTRNKVLCFASIIKKDLARRMMTKKKKNFI